MTNIEDSTLKFKDVRHTVFGGVVKDGKYQHLSIREGAGGPHVTVNPRDYRVDMRLTPVFRPYWVRGKYNTNCFVHVTAATQARYYKPGLAWEEVELKEIPL